MKDKNIVFSEEPLKYKMPIWVEESFVLPYRSGVSHFFIFHGDTDGLVMNPFCEIEPDETYIAFRDFLRKVFKERSIVLTYDVSSGMRFLKSEMEKEFMKLCGFEDPTAGSSDPIAAAKATLAVKRGLPLDPNSCLPLIEKALYKSRDMAVIIKSAHFVAPNPGANGLLPPTDRINIQTLRNWSQSARLKSLKHIIVLITDDILKISPELRSNGSYASQVFVPKPNKEERIDFINDLTYESRKKIFLEKGLPKTKKPAESENIKKEISELGPTISLPSDFDVSVFAHGAQGMSFRQISEIFQQVQSTGETLSLSFVKKRKKTILNDEYGELMEIVEAQRGFEDIGGLTYIKRYLSKVLGAIKSAEYRLVPMGIYFMGPPGTGKTALVEALAKEAEFNFIKTKNIRSMWVGESESRMQRFIYALRSLAPVVVMNDEADLADAQRDAPKGDSGVSERLMRMWMEFLSDPKIRGQVVVISCTNRPDRIDPALKRSGRGDQRILIPMPSCDELPDIFKVMFKRYNIPTDLKEFMPFAKKTEGFSGADIEAIVLTSFRFADGKTVNEEALSQGIEDFIPSASQSAIDFMTIVGLMECSSKELLPPHIGEIVQGIINRGLIENLDYYITQLKSRKII